ncbi:MAG TPA: LacI family DNA-binding transcriptional regulator [Anaeromyxobacter sp.]|nr:LacI family DNA-binding transcriptional regulator [Anaeromyxobacter sp.]
MPASIREVARMAGVSTATVSRVVTGAAFVEKGTQEKVLEAIRVLNYVPNLLAKGLKSRSGGFIGLVLTEISHEYFSAVISYIEDAVSARGYTLILANAKGQDRTGETEVLHKLLGREVDGIILMTPSLAPEMLQALRRGARPVVAFDCYHDAADTHRVLLDEYRAGRLAADHLADLGHRDLYCITGPRQGHISGERLRGFREGLVARGIELGEERVFPGDFEYQSGLEAARRILRGRQRVTAVWAQNDVMALAAMAELQRAGRSIPGDHSVLGMDDVPLADFSHPRLSTIRQPLKDMCRKAVHLLIKLREGGRASRKVFFEPTLLVRESTERRE